MFEYTIKCIKLKVLSIVDHLFSMIILSVHFLEEKVEDLVE